MTNALMIGKFYPPHRGHHRVIRQAAAECGRVTVVVMASAGETVPLDARTGWLRREHAGEPVTVRGVRCEAPVDVTDPVIWDAQVAAMRAALDPAERIDVLYCGDGYGPELARRFGARLASVDRDGLSASAVRADLLGHWSDVAPAVRAGLAVRAVVVGAESTGTTTLSRALAARYRARGGAWAQTQWVAEYGREYTEVKWRRECPDRPLAEMTWTAEDFDAVAAEQTRREDDAAAAGSLVLVCDTDAFATSVWERRYLGKAARSLPPWAEAARADVYLVTDHDGVPWDDDGLREGDLDIRAAMTGWFTRALTEAGRPWVLLTGPWEDRLRIAERTVDQLVEIRSQFGEPLRGPGFEATI
jgi:NadR type nicotinamide-nucleotide adenylyltransferase